MEKEKIQNLIKEIVEKTLVSVKDISVTEDGPKNTWFGVEVSDPHLFTAREGEGLYALNHIVRRITDGDESLGDASFLIDIGGFQKKRVENIRAVAHMMSERARYFKSSIEVDPMSAFERRIVHEFLAEAPDLQTESTGMGRTRRVVIKYTGEL